MVVIGLFDIDKFMGLSIRVGLEHEASKSSTSNWLSGMLAWGTNESLRSLSAAGFLGQHAVCCLCRWHLQFFWESLPFPQLYFVMGLCSYALLISTAWFAFAMQTCNNFELSHLWRTPFARRLLRVKTNCWERHCHCNTCNNYKGTWRSLSIYTLHHNYKQRSKFFGNANFAGHSVRNDSKPCLEPVQSQFSICMSACISSFRDNHANLRWFQCQLMTPKDGHMLYKIADAILSCNFVFICNLSWCNFVQYLCKKKLYTFMTSSDDINWLTNQYHRKMIKVYLHTSTHNETWWNCTTSCLASTAHNDLEDNTVVWLLHHPLHQASSSHHRIVTSKAAFSTHVLRFFQSGEAGRNWTASEDIVEREVKKDHIVLCL